MFYGEYSHSIDPKGRLTIPSKIRQELGDECVITRGLADCLNVYSLEAFHAIEKHVHESNDYSPEYMEYARGFFSSVQLCTYDKQGRILINPSLKNKVNLTKDVMIIGTGLNIELWDKETWEEYSNISNREFAALGTKVLGKKFGV